MYKTVVFVYDQWKCIDIMYDVGCTMYDVEGMPFTSLDLRFTTRPAGQAGLGMSSPVYRLTNLRAGRK